MKRRKAESLPQRAKRSKARPSVRRPLHADVETTRAPRVVTPQSKPPTFSEKMRDVYTRPLPNEER